MAGGILQTALIFLAVALLFVPIAKKLGIGSVLGYLIGGAIIGPFVLGLVGHEGEDIMHAAEFGVVMMLFVIGLEMNPRSFWDMRKNILGMGGMQMGLTTLLLFPILNLVLGLSVTSSIALALSFSMSSTAIVMQTLKEKYLDKTHAGVSSFSVLLFQDIAVIPLLAILPLLAVNYTTETAESANEIIRFLNTYPSLKVAIAAVFIWLLSKFFIGPFLHFISKVHMRELFTASALFIVIGVAKLMELAGVSAALGAFMAGVLLANSEFRHELESDIEPFKGLLLGLFFTAVGSTINFGLILQQPNAIFTAVWMVMIIKLIVLFVIGKVFKLVLHQSLLFSLLLSQVGEFAFVLLGSAGLLQIINKTELDFYMAVVTITMIVSPVLLFVFDKYLSAKLQAFDDKEPEYEVNNTNSHTVIIAGFGHFGSTLGRFLRANGVNATILDNDSERVMLLRKMGFNVFYGDATRLDLLEAAGAAKAEILISAIDIPELNIELAALTQKHFPHLKIFMRAKNRVDAYEFIEMGIERIYRESIHASVKMGVDVLAEFGLRRYTLYRKANDFIRFDEEAMKKLAADRHDTGIYVNSVKKEIEFQEKMLNEDKQFSDRKSDSAWDKSVFNK